MVFSLAVITARTTTLGLLLDFDNCTDTATARDTLMRYVETILKDSPQITRVKIVINSARQSVWLDFLNAANHAANGFGDFQSCNILGKAFRDQLEAMIQSSLGAAAPAVIFEPILLSDILHNLPPGTTFSHLSQDFNRSFDCAVNAFKKTSHRQGFDSIVLSTVAPIAALKPNSFHLCCHNQQFFAYFSADIAPILISPTVQDTLIRHLTFWGLWNNGLINTHFEFSKNDNEWATISIDILTNLCGKQNILYAKNFDGLDVPLLRISSKGSDDAGSKSLPGKLKTCLTWFFAQGFAEQLTEHCALLCFDDRQDILSSLTRCDAALWPSTIRLQCVHFNAVDLENQGAAYVPSLHVMVQGTGAQLCRENVQAILLRMAHSPNRKMPEEFYKQALLQYIYQPHLPDLSVSQYANKLLLMPPANRLDCMGVVAVSPGISTPWEMPDIFTGIIHRPGFVS